MLIAVHGYNQDPADPDHSASRKGGCFDVWYKMLPDRPLTELHWYSGRTGLKGRWRAIREGYWRNTYAYAYDRLAPLAAKRLIDLAGNKRPDVICHSLGSRVTLLAMRDNPRIFNRVIFLNAAETVNVATPIIEKSYCAVMNICVETDDALSLVGGFGQAGLEIKRSGFEQIFLDSDSDYIKCLQKYDTSIAGDNPNSIIDHHFSYTHKGNWPVYRSFLK